MPTCLLLACDPGGTDVDAGDPGLEDASLEADAGGRDSGSSVRDCEASVETRACTTVCGLESLEVCGLGGRWAGLCPNQSEVCANGVDDNCDGRIDEFDSDETVLTAAPGATSSEVVRLASGAYVVLQDGYFPTTELTEWGLQVVHHPTSSSSLLRRTGRARAMSLHEVEGRAYGLVVDGVGAHFFAVSESGSLVGEPIELATGSYTSGVMTPTATGFVVYLSSETEVTALAVGRDGSAVGAPAQLQGSGAVGLASIRFGADHLVAFWRFDGVSGMYRVQRVSEVGAVVGSERDLAAVGHINRPALAVAGERALIVYLTDDPSTVVRMQVLDTDLSLVGSPLETEITTTYPSGPRAPVAGVYDGGFFAAWLDEDPDGADAADAAAFARRVSPDGTPIGEDLVLLPGVNWNYYLARIEERAGGLTLIGNAAWPYFFTYSGCL